jgi:hypothetical protein
VIALEPRTGNTTNTVNEIMMIIIMNREIMLQYMEYAVKRLSYQFGAG